MSPESQHSADEQIYLDCNATTPIHPRVRTAMEPWLGPQWGNPSSGHALGQRAERAVAEARVQVAALLEVDSDEIVFTGGGTESDNLAVFGSRPRGLGPGRLVISNVEHPAVDAPARELERRGWCVDRLRVDAGGRIDLDAAASMLARPADVVSVIFAQNETGVVQPVRAVAELARAGNPRAVVHTDAAQAVGKVDVHPRRMGVDLLTLVGHKMYAPKGIGALYVRRGVALQPLVFGGGQENGLRPGTENVAAIVGLGAASSLAAGDLREEAGRQASLRERLWSRLVDLVPQLRRTAAGAASLPGTLHVCFPDREGSSVLAAATTVAASTGSACHTGMDGQLGVLIAMGLAPEIARGAVRLSLGRMTTAEDVDAAAEALGRAHAQSGR